MLATADRPKRAKKSKSPKAPPPAPETKQLLKRLEEQHKLGEQIKRKDAQRAKQETVCAEAKAELDSQRETLHKYERELEELKDDLTNLAVGGFVDRLPFGEKSTAPANGQAATSPAPASDNAWRDVPVSDLGIAKKHVVNRLIEGGVTNFGELEDWRASRNTKPEIKGMGEAAMQAVEDAIDEYWVKHPRTTAADKTPVEVKPLEWVPGESEFEWVADNTAGILNDEDEPMQFNVTNEAGAFKLFMSADPLMPIHFPAHFDTCDQAKAFCEARNRELATKAREQMPEAFEKTPVPAGLEGATVSVNGSEFVPVEDVMKVWNTKGKPAKKSKRAKATK